MVTLDTEKAFDPIVWRNMCMVLDRRGFCSSFIQWMDLLYCSPQASNKLGDMISALLSIRRSIRQGCPQLLILQ